MDHMRFSLLVLYYCISCLVFGAQWHEVGTTLSPMFDVGFNSYNTSFSSEFTPEGSNVVDSTDLGAHWTVLSTTNDGSMDLGCSSLSNQTAVITSILGRGIYTVDGGNTWRTTVGFVAGMQGLTRTKDKSQIYGGADNTKMRISKDFGATWTEYRIGNLSFGGRYVAMPTASTYYVSCGGWTGEQKYDISSKIRYNMYSNRIEFNFEYRNKVDSKNKRKLLQPLDKMWGAIYKSSDAGTTWTEQFYNEDTFYFNGIDCCDVNNCYAVSEGDSESGSQNPGSRVWMTSDGGNKWNMVFHDPDDGASLMAVKCLSNGTEAYAGGGDIASGRDFSGYIFHTTDRGQTWSNFTAKGSVLAMDINDAETRGIAVGMSRTEGGVTYGFY